MLARQLAGAGVSATVWSAGMLPGGEPPPPEVISVMARLGADVSSHRSRALSSRDLDRADLILAMERAHVRHAAVMSAGAWPRMFTIKELIRRSERVGPRQAHESLTDWLARAHTGRTRADLLGTSPDDDVADPYGGPEAAYADAAEHLDHLLGRLIVGCLAPVPRSGRPF